MKNLIFILLSSFLLVIACKKEDPVTKPTTTSTTSSTSTTATTSTTSTTSTTDTTTHPTDTIEQLIEIKTTFGTMYMWLYKGTPQHRANYLTLAQNHYLDSTTFHRCIKGFMIQGGDPNSKDADTTNDGEGGPGYTIPAEIDTSLYKHKRGAVGAARDDNPDKASSGSQFYISVSTSGTRHLDNNYTVFGEIISGMEVADKIVKQPQNNQNNRPYTDIKMAVNKVERTRQQLRDEFNFYTPDK